MQSSIEAKPQFFELVSVFYTLGNKEGFFTQREGKSVLLSIEY